MGSDTERSFGDVHNVDSSRVTDSSAFDQATMSTTDGYPDMPPNVFRMLMVLEETTESGVGPMELHEKTIGYQITRLGTIGQGRFGTVFRGVHRGENVAVKVFPVFEITAFEKEVYIYEVGMLRHPNVLRYIGSDRYGNATHSVRPRVRFQ